MNIAAMLEPTHVAPYPHMTSASSSPSEPSLQQRLPPITHVTSTLHHQPQLQPLSAHNMQQHTHMMPQPLSSQPSPRQVLPPRIDSMSSNYSSTVEYTPQPQPPSSTTHRSPNDNTVRRDSSASSSHTNRHQRRRPGGQTKAACLPCRKRKSKVCFVRFHKQESSAYPSSRNSVMAVALAANAASQRPQRATTASQSPA